MDRNRAAELDELRRRIAQIEEQPASRDSKGVGRSRAQHDGAANNVSSSVPTRTRHTDDAAIESTREDAESPRERDVAAADAFARIERLVSFRDYASEELRRRLAREGYDELHASEAIDRALRCGLVDDLRFADAFVRGKLAKGQGVHGIEAALAQLNIDASELPGWPEEYLPCDERGEVARALALLDARPPRSKNLRESAFRKLVSKGFSSDVAASAARRWVESNSE